MMRNATILLGLFGLVLSGPLPAAATQTCRTADLTASTPTNRFIVNNDGTVRDKVTGLTWKRCSEGLNGNSCEKGAATTHTWQDARTSAAASRFAGKDDWRLPTLAELESIIEYQCTMPAINTTVFPATPALNFWSDASYAGYVNGAWNINFNDGVKDSCSKNFQLYVRHVRGGK